MEVQEGNTAKEESNKKWDSKGPDFKLEEDPKVPIRSRSSGQEKEKTTARSMSKRIEEKAIVDMDKRDKELGKANLGEDLPSLSLSNIIEEY